MLALDVESNACCHESSPDEVAVLCPVSLDSAK